MEIEVGKTELFLIIAGVVFLVGPLFLILVDILTNGRKGRKYSQLIEDFKKNYISFIKEHCNFEELIKAGNKLQHGERVIFTFSELCKLKEISVPALVPNHSDKLSKFDLPEKIDLSLLYKTDAVEVEKFRDKIILRPVVIEEYSGYVVPPDLYVSVRDILKEIFKDNPEVIVSRESEVIR